MLLLPSFPQLQSAEFVSYLSYLEVELLIVGLTVALMDCGAAVNHGLSLCSSWKIGISGLVGPTSTCRVVNLTLEVYFLCSKVLVITLI